MMASQQGKSQVLGGHGGEGNDFLKKNYCRVSPVFDRTRKNKSRLNLEPGNLNFVMVLSHCVLLAMPL